MDTDRHALIVNRENPEQDAHMLRSAGYTPDIAGSLEHARELMKSRVYQVVLAPPGVCVPRPELPGGQSEDGLLKQSDELLWKAFHSSPQVMVVSRLDDGRYVDINEAFVETFGYAREEAVGHTSAELGIWPDSAERNQFVQILRKGEVIRSAEATFYTRSGRALPSLFSAIKIDIAGEECLLAIINDVSERKQAEEAVRRSQELLQSIIDNIPSAVYVKDLDGHIMVANQALADLLGVDKDILAGSTSYAFYPAEIAKEHIDNDRHVIESGRPYQTEESTAEHQGSRVFITQKFPIRDAQGTIYGVGGISTDITERKRAGEALSIAHQEAERRVAEMKSVLSNLADGIVVVDVQGRVLFLNQAGRQILRLRPGEQISNWLTHFQRAAMNGMRLEPHNTPTGRALRGEIVTDERGRWSTHGGEVVVSITASPVRDSQGQVIGATCAFRDATAQVEYEAKREEMLERERHIANVLQKALVPEVPYQAPCCDVAVRYEAALSEAEVGGDFYDVFDVGDDKLGVVIADVAGKGLPAAIRVAAARHAIRSYAYVDPRPSRVLSLANDSLCRDSLETVGMLTAFLAVIDTRLGIIVYANGGHEPPILRTATGRLVEMKPTGPALGVVPGTRYTERTARLNPDDTLLMVTDGITEARPSPAELFGIEGVRAYMEDANRAIESVDQVAAGILEAARRHGGGRLRDDVAVVVFRWTNGNSE